MFDKKRELALSARNGDLPAIIGLSSQPDFDVNVLLDELCGWRAVDYAAMHGHGHVLEHLIVKLKASFMGYYINRSVDINVIPTAYWAMRAPEPVKMIKILYDNGYDINSKSFPDYDTNIRFGINPKFYQLKRSLLGYLASHIDSGSFPQKHVSLFAFALRYGDLHDKTLPKAESILQVIEGCSKDAPPYMARLLLIEGLIRGDRDVIATLSKRNFRITFGEVEEQIGDRKFDSTQINASRKCRNVFVKEGILDGELNDWINRRLFLGRCATTIDSEDLPKCLRTYQKPMIEKSLDEIISMLSYARGIAPSPYTLQQVESNKDVNHKEYQDFILKNPALYTLESLRKFIHPANVMQSMIEMRLYPGIIEIICCAFDHSQLSDKDKQRCAYLLLRYENPSEAEQSTLIFAEINYNLSVKLATENAELKEYANAQAAAITKLQSDIAELKQLVNSLLTSPNETNESSFFSKRTK